MRISDWSSDVCSSDLFEEQLGCADMVVINKADLLDEARLAEVEAIVARHLRPAVTSLRASHGAIDVAVLLGLAAAAEDDLDGRRHEASRGGKECDSTGITRRPPYH